MSTPATIQATAESSRTLNVPKTLRRVVLTGFMGAGKSTVGRLVAQRLGWKFVDLDDHLETRAGISVDEIFALHGEQHFRRLESSALASALAASEVVLALGGGTPESLTNRLLLEQTPGTVTVFLEAPFPALFDRCVLQSVSRPILADPTVAALRFAERTPIYRRLARYTVDTSQIDSADAARAVLDALIERHVTVRQATQRAGRASE